MNYYFDLLPSFGPPNTILNYIHRIKDLEKLAALTDTKIAKFAKERLAAFQFASRASTEYTFQNKRKESLERLNRTMNDHFMLSFRELVFYGLKDSQSLYSTCERYASITSAFDIPLLTCSLRAPLKDEIRHLSSYLSDLQNLFSDSPKLAHQLLFTLCGGEEAFKSLPEYKFQDLDNLLKNPFLLDAPVMRGLMPTGSPCLILCTGRTFNKKPKIDVIYCTPTGEMVVPLNPWGAVADCYRGPRGKLKSSTEFNQEMYLAYHKLITEGRIEIINGGQQGYVELQALFVFSVNVPVRY